MLMKMSFQRRNNRNKLFIYVIAIGIIIVLMWMGALKFLANIIVLPFQYVESLVSDRDIEKENKELKIQVEKLNLMLLGNEDSNVPDNTYRVITRPPENLYGLLLVEMGDYGIGDPVYSLSGSYIGFVESSSNVKLISFPSLRTEARVARSGIPIVAEGIGGGNLRAELPRGSDIKEGDVVLDSENRIIAQVITIEEDEASAFTRALLRVPVNIFEIQYVSI